MRVSDVERQRVVDELRRHSMSGRLAMDEYAARVAEALSAETLAELDRALRDLPMVRIADPSTAVELRRRRRVVAHALVLVATGAAAVILAVSAHLLGAALLVAGWVVGLLQGRAVRRW